MEADETVFNFLDNYEPGVESDALLDVIAEILIQFHRDISKFAESRGVRDGDDVASDVIKDSFEVLIRQATGTLRVRENGKLEIGFYREYKDRKNTLRQWLLATARWRIMAKRTEEKRYFDRSYSFEGLLESDTLSEKQREALVQEQEISDMDVVDDVLEEIGASRNHRLIIRIDLGLHDYGSVNDIHTLLKVAEYTGFRGRELQKIKTIAKSLCLEGTCGKEDIGMLVGVGPDQVRKVIRNFRKRLSETLSAA